MASGCVRDDVAHLVLGVETAIARAVVDSPRAYRRQPRIFVDLQAPTLIIGQMPVQHIQLVPRHPVDHGMYERGRLKMPRGIQHEPAPRVAGRIDDGLRGNAAGAAVRRQQLPQGHGAVKKPRAAACRYGDSMRPDLKLVAFRAESLGATEGDRRVCGAAAQRDRNRQRQRIAALP